MIKISVSQLATLDRCEKCFWLAATGHIKQSVQTLPGYFNILIQNELKNNNNTPSWLNTENGTLVHLNPNQKRFKTNYKHLSVVGVVDDFLQIAENTCALVRYKTLPFSEIRVKNELNILGWVCQVNDIDVTEAYIFAFTPIRFHSELCSLEFDVSKSVVEIATNHVPALLDKANEIIKSEVPPKPSSKCQRCGWSKEE